MSALDLDPSRLGVIFVERSTLGGAHFSSARNLVGAQPINTTVETLGLHPDVERIVEEEVTRARDLLPMPHWRGLELVAMELPTDTDQNHSTAMYVHSESHSVTPLIVFDEKLVGRDFWSTDHFEETLRETVIMPAGLKGVDGILRWVIRHEISHFAVYEILGTTGRTEDFDELVDQKSRVDAVHGLMTDPEAFDLADAIAAHFGVEDPNSDAYWNHLALSVGISARAGFATLAAANGTAKQKLAALQEVRAEAVVTYLDDPSGSRALSGLGREVFGEFALRDDVVEVLEEHWNTWLTNFARNAEPWAIKEARGRIPGFQAIERTVMAEARLEAGALQPQTTLGSTAMEL